MTREQIEAQITALEQIPEQQRTPGDTKRLQMLQDTRMFEGEYFILSLIHIFLKWSRLRLEQATFR